MLEVLAIVSFQKWILDAFALTLTAILIPRFRVTSIFGPFFAVVTLAFFNAHVWSTALFFQVPNSLTLHAGLLLIVNGVIFWVLVKLLPGIEVTGIFPAIAAPVVFTILSVGVETYGKDVEWGQVLSAIVSFFAYLKGYFLATPVSEGVP